FCEVPPDEEGETPLADAREVTARLDPAVRARFEAGGVGVRRWLPPADDGPQDRVPRPWNQVFLTADRAEAERQAEEKRWRIDWRSDGSMWLWQQVLPAFRMHPRTGERVWANQVHYHTPECLLRWALRDRRRDDAEQLRHRLAHASDEVDCCFHQGGAAVS